MSDAPAPLRDLRALAADPARLRAARALDLAFPAGSRPRRSAVLILFGELDRIDAGSDPATTVPANLDVLLIQRALTLRHHAGQIAFPGGGREPGDADLTATALREANEETGLDAAGVEPLGALPEFPIPVSNNLVTPVLGWWRAPSAVAPDEGEATGVFRVPVAELLDPARRGTSVLAYDGRTHRGPAFRLGPRFGEAIVWGFTGILLDRVFDALGWAVAWDRDHEIPITP